MRFMQPMTRIDSYMYSFFPSAIKIWKDLPQNVIDSNDIDHAVQTKISYYLICILACMYVVTCALYSSRGLHSITNNNNKPIYLK